ncbi:MAG: MFS transporter [Cytophagales bacterium]
MGVEKRRLSFWEIWNMSFGFLGIQFGFALQNANTSRIFETLGADTKNLAIYWLAAPVTGLLIQPIIGYYSDRTWHPYWGRRRPFFAIGALLATIALIIMPNSPTLWVAIGMLWVMDGSINISMEPFRAFVGDLLPPDQRTRGFAMQSFFIGVGSVIASALPWFFSEIIGVQDENLGANEIPTNVKWSFYLGAFAFLTAVMWTVFSTKEYPPEEDEEKREKEHFTPIKYKPKTYSAIGLAMLLISALLTLVFYWNSLDPQLYVLSGIFGLFGFSYLGASIPMYRNKYKNGFVNIVRDFQNMPKTMIQLAFVQFFSWFALFAMWIYTTSGITSHIYDMKLSAQELYTLNSEMENFDKTVLQGERLEKFKNIENELAEYLAKLKNSENELAVVSVNFAKYFVAPESGFEIDEELESDLKRVRMEYDEGADWVGILFGGYNGIAALAALMLPWLAKKTSRRMTHLIALCLGGLGLISFYFINDPMVLIVSMIGVGIAWASILSIPYAMLSSSLPASKMGYYMGIFNFFIVIPQMVAASILAFMVTSLFGSEFIFALIIGGISMILAGLLSLIVDDKDEVLMKEPQ